MFNTSTCTSLDINYQITNFLNAKTSINKEFSNSKGASQMFKSIK